MPHFFLYNFRSEIRISKIRISMKNNFLVISDKTEMAGTCSRGIFTEGSDKSFADSYVPVCCVEEISRIKVSP